MTARKRRTPPVRRARRTGGADGTTIADGQALPLGPTGRTIVVTRPGPTAETLRALKNVAGVTAASTEDFADAAATDDVAPSGAVLLHNIDVVIVDGDVNQVRSLEAAIS